VPKPKDIVHQQTATTGTGNMTLTAVNGKQSFSDAFSTGAANNFVYYLSNQDASEWERGEGYCSDANTLVRSTVNANSLGTTAKIDFTAGTIDVVNDIPAAKQVQTTATSVTTGHAVVYESSDGTVIGTAGFQPVHSTDTSVTTGDAVVYKTADGQTIGTASAAPVTAGQYTQLLAPPFVYSSTTEVSFTGTTGWTNALATTFTPQSSSSTLLTKTVLTCYHGEQTASRSRVEARLSRGATSSIIGTTHSDYAYTANYNTKYLTIYDVSTAHGLSAETTITAQVRHALGNDFAAINQSTAAAVKSASYIIVWEYE
jgi:hypothetical protein